jgi:hypothetical protein
VAGRELARELNAGSREVAWKVLLPPNSFGLEAMVFKTWKHTIHISFVYHGRGFRVLGF